LNAVLESRDSPVQTLPGGILNVVSKLELARCRLDRADHDAPGAHQLCEGDVARASVASILTKRGQAVADSTSKLTRHHRGQLADRGRVEFVKGLDLRTPQVSIQAKIIFVESVSTSKSLGV